MKRSLTPQERRLIERELIAREEAKERRRIFYSRTFWIGVPATVLCAFLREFSGMAALSVLLGLISFGCLLIYTEFLVIPSTFQKDSSIGWHLNPWQEVLYRLDADGRFKGGVVFLVSYPLSRILFSTLALLWR